MSSLELREYQQEDVDFARRLPAVGIFNEPRTGKTPTSIAIVQDALPNYGNNRFVVVAPASMLYRWKDEIEEWSGLPAVVIKGTKAKRNNLISNWEEGALIINYESLRDFTKKINGVKHQRPGHYDAILKKKPQAVIVDEAHRIKGRTNVTAKAVQRLASIPKRIALTGTPAPNRPEEVWAILHFLYPKAYPGYWSWVDLHFYTVPSRFSQASDILGFYEGHEQQVQQELNRFCTNRKRKDIMPWLPDVPAPVKIRLPLTNLQTKYLTELEEFFETEHIVTQGVLDRIMKYRRICNAPEIENLRGSSPKLDWLLEYLIDYPDTPTIFFTKFSTFARLIEKKTKGKCSVYDGNVDLKERQVLINQFQSGKINSLVIQIDAGKEGLTLDRAEKIVFLDQVPPAADILQAQDRFIATVPDKASIPKEIIYLMMADSYDELLYDLVEQRASEIDVINSYLKYITKE